MPLSSEREAEIRKSVKGSCEDEALTDLLADLDASRATVAKLREALEIARHQVEHEIIACTMSGPCEKCDVRHAKLDRIIALVGESND